MKDILEKLIETDTSYNKSVTRYLHKTHPELWKEILILTDFLPERAKPKQRVWHILKDVWQIPRCPVTGEIVKWCEHRYLTTKNHKARRQLQEIRGDFKNSHAPEINEKRRQSNLKAVHEGRKYRNKASYTNSQKRKMKETFIKNYGVDNPSKHPDIKRKISEARIENGATPRALRTDRKLYHEAVWRFTEQSWREFFHEINPQRLNRSEMALDHIFSVQEGFNQGVPPCWLGLWTYLRLITLVENSKKGMACDKTLDQLIGDATLSLNKVYAVSANGNSLSQKRRYQQGTHNLIGIAKKRLEDGTSNLLEVHQCPRCGRVGRGPVMKRHHFTNCKVVDQD